MRDIDYYLKVDNLYDRALLLVSELFKNKKDKAGLPYINHLIRVSINFDTEELRIAGLLHDVLEDTKVTKNDLSKLGFSKRILEIVDGVTIEDGLDYNSKIKKIIDSKDMDIIKLKYVDMCDNMDKDRLSKLPIIMRNRLISKYKNNLKLLEKVLEVKK